MKRRADAWALLRAGDRHARGAGYLGGCAIECRLKAIAMEVFDCWTLDRLAGKWHVDDQALYTHGLESLVRRLPLYHRFRASDVWRDFASHVNRRRVYWRYDPLDWSCAAATEFLTAVDRVYQWLDANRC
jgi:hypothetical protein